jgi:hypothetical protein
MKTDAEVVRLQDSHVRDIVERNIFDGVAVNLSVSVDDMIRAYFSPGSTAYCLVIQKVPIVAGGIINFGWNRGEAWLLTSSLFYQYRKTSFKAIKQMFPGLAAIGKFRRVQAVCWNGSEILFQHLGFKKEATLEAYGPNGQTCDIYARLF